MKITFPLKRKLLFSFLSIILLLVFIIGITYYQFKKVVNEYDILIDQKSTEIQLVTDLYKNTTSEVIAIRGYLASGMEANLKDYEQAREDFKNNMDNYKKIADGKEMESLCNEMVEAEKAYASVADEMIEAKKQDNTDIYVHLMETTGKRAIANITSISKELLKTQQNLMHTKSTNLSKSTSTTLAGILSFSIVIIAIGVVVAAVMARIISKPIQLVSKAAEEIADGNLTIDQLKVKSKDETGVLAASFNRMVENLKNTIKDVIHASEQVASSSEELTAISEQITDANHQIVLSIQEVSDIIEEQGRDTEESAQTVGEITIGVQRLAESAGTVAASASDTTNQANIGSNYIQRVIGQMNLIHDSSLETSSVMKELQLKTEEIGKITDVITEISKQTNLLALNAAIESARAGEHGKGFAVVADEVRKLAEQSRASANKIIEIIQKVQESTTVAKEITDKGNETVENGLQLVEETGRVFDRILKSIEDINAQTQEVSAISEEISASTEQVNASVEEVAQLAKTSTTNTNEIASASEEQLATLQDVTSSANSLAKMAENLQELVQKFKL